MNRIVLSICLFACASIAHAQSVTLPPQIRGSVGSWIIVAPKVDGGAPKWRVDSGLEEVDLSLLLPAELIAKLRGKVFTSPVDGKFKVEVWNAKGDVASDIATCWIIIGKPGPGPNPPPVDPPPTPIPTKIVAHVTFVGPEKTAASLTTNNDLSLREWFVTNKIKVHVLKENDPGIASSGLTETVKEGGGVPLVVLQDSVGNVIGFARMTTSTAAKTLITPYLGK